MFDLFTKSRGDQPTVFDHMKELNGRAGQFRTPRHIIRMMVDMVEPKKDDTICDPACGTAGFLVSSGEYLRDNHADWFHEKGGVDRVNDNARVAFG